MPPADDCSFRRARRLLGTAAALVPVLVLVLASCSLPTSGAGDRPAATMAPPGASPVPAPAGLASARTVVLIGDSLAQQAAPYLQPLLGDRAFVPQFFGGTAPCDWVGKDLGTTPDSVAILSFTGNSSTPCMANGLGGFLHGQALVDRYFSDLSVLLAQVRATGARVLLVGQPQRAGISEVQVEVDGVNVVYLGFVEEGVVFFVDAGAAVEDAAGLFTRQLPCLPGEAACGPDGTNVVRSDDGVHFCPGANPTPCDVYSSGAFRFATAIAGAINDA